MIRIDEIYSNTFFPWLEKNKPGFRFFVCDPFGRSDSESVISYGCTNIPEHNYIFCFDQEPIHLDLHIPTFETVKNFSSDITYRKGLLGPGSSNAGYLLTSEKNSDQVNFICSKYEWQPLYYFFHGWACMDWFRGYDKTFLIPRASERSPTKTFISPNRIVAGKRDHRVLFLYNVFKQGLDSNWISAPRVCPYENVDIIEIAKKYNSTYKDIEQVFRDANLPKLFFGEEIQQMTSCWLTNFPEAADSLVYVPTETVFFGRRWHLTEKTFKAIALEMPFVLVAPAGSLEYLREYGFKTFASIFDESYDEETNDIRRVEKVTKLLKDLDNLSIKERQEIHRACLPIVEHNYNHFYKGGFSDILWAELITMLNGI